MDGAPGTDARIGDTVVAADGAVGRVECIVMSEASAPTYLVVVAASRFRRRYPVVPWTLVRRVDRVGRRIHVDGHRGCVGRLPESLPFAL